MSLIKYAVTCPGQGFVREGLLGPLKQFEHIYKDDLTVIDDSLQEKFSDQLYTHSSDWLMKTSNAQPAIVATTYIINKILREHYGLDVVKHSRVILGHSLGEYSGLLLSDRLDLSTTMKLVRLRGKLMESLDTSEYSMKVLTFKSEKFLEILHACNKNSIVANINHDQQITISGKTNALNTTIKEINNNKHKRVISRITSLPVSIPFHNSLIQSIEPDLLQYSESIRPSSLPMITNLTGEEKTNDQEIFNNIIAVNSKPVQWVKSMNHLSNLGITHVINMGPGTILHNINKKYPFKNFSLDDFATDLDTIKSFYPIQS